MSNETLIIIPAFVDQETIEVLDMIESVLPIDRDELCTRIIRCGIVAMEIEARACAGSKT